jgi:hypothetical protein
MFTNAVRWQLIMNNPCARIKPSKVEKLEVKYYNEEETETMVSFLEKE